MTECEGKQRRVANGGSAEAADYRGDYTDLQPIMLELPEAGVSATSVNVCSPSIWVRLKL